MKDIRLTVRQDDENAVEFIIHVEGDDVDIRRVRDCRLEADRTAPVDIVHDHCPFCTSQPEDDEACESMATTLVLSVEFADG